MSRCIQRRVGVVSIVVAGMLASCSHQRVLPEVDPMIRGNWTGEGWFLDVKLDREYGRFPAIITIHPDNTVSGSVGAASIKEGAVKQRTSDFLVQGRLTGPVFERGTLPAEGKDRVVILIQLDKNGSFKDGNIHLKTNFTFDFTMRVGGLTLTRSS